MPKPQTKAEELAAVVKEAMKKGLYAALPLPGESTWTGHPMEAYAYTQRGVDPYTMIYSEGYWSVCHDESQNPMPLCGPFENFDMAYNFYTVVCRLEESDGG